MSREKIEHCDRTVREPIHGLISELYCREPAVWEDLSNGCYYCESCIRFVSHGVLKRIERKERENQ